LAITVPGENFALGKSEATKIFFGKTLLKENSKGERDKKSL
jgi:hypothetical protein